MLLVYFTTNRGEGELRDRQNPQPQYWHEIRLVQVPRIRGHQKARHSTHRRPEERQQQHFRHTQAPSHRLIAPACIPRRPMKHPSASFSSHNASFPQNHNNPDENDAIGNVLRRGRDKFAKRTAHDYRTLAQRGHYDFAAVYAQSHRQYSADANDPKSGNHGETDSFSGPLLVFMREIQSDDTVDCQTGVTPIDQYDNDHIRSVDKIADIRPNGVAVAFGEDQQHGYRKSGQTVHEIDDDEVENLEVDSMPAVGLGPGDAEDGDIVDGADEAERQGRGNPCGELCVWDGESSGYFGRWDRVEFCEELLRNDMARKLCILIFFLTIILLSLFQTSKYTPYNGFVLE